MQPSFNLIDEPWIVARTLDGTQETLSLAEVFERATMLERLTNDLPTQDFAILRLLIAILQSAVVYDLDADADPYEVWGSLWRERELPLNLVESYLQEWHDRFDLFDEAYPFMQVAGMEATNGSVSEIKKIIADHPDGDPLFSIKAGQALNAIPFADAARWLVHVQAYDTSGIKTGVVGDSQVKGGKSYPIGTGWAGRLGGVSLRGANLAETLLLNLVLRDGAEDALVGTNEDLPEDLPVWERPPQQPGDEGRSPCGPCDLYTWQARRVLLIPKNDAVVGVVLSNGNKLEAYDLNALEPMTAWRRSPNKEKELRRSPVYLPATHQPARALWRGLLALLPDRGNEGSDSLLAPGVVTWAGDLASKSYGSQLAEDYPLGIVATGVEYGVQSAVISTTMADELWVSAYLLSPEGEGLNHLAKECMEATDKAVRSLGNFARDLCAAEGDSSGANGVRDAVTRHAYFELDAAFRAWLASLGPQSYDKLEAIRATWHRTAKATLRRIARDLVAQAGAQAVVGRSVKNRNGSRWVSAGSAESSFNYWLNQALPYGDEDMQNAEGGV